MINSSKKAMAIGSVPFINMGLFIHDITSVRFLKKLSTVYYSYFDF